MAAALAIVVSGCNDTEKPATPPTSEPAGDPALHLAIDPGVCPSHTQQYAYRSGTDRVSVEGVFDGACKVVVSREQNGATTIYDCRIPTGAPIVDLRRDDGQPFRVASGSLECRKMAFAAADGVVTDTRDDTAVYRPF